jgi:hypothetical protein
MQTSMVQTLAAPPSSVQILLDLTSVMQPSAMPNLAVQILAVPILAMQTLAVPI